ncbi:hypothetical protein [Dyadobacter sp. CY312]|uniref:hypothetical protein n=1 Tax=Dyadobacter sp. CY312 TaxID=2907303 RepID=UPI001F1BCBD0|nr:hypothetical protein [Dyadobacter sp. CY312]MCE7042131.1 hypothetical protein [Dyadobacter sp. CY312]
MKMKLSVYFLGLLMIGLTFSCEKSDIDFEDDIEKSEKAWKAFRSSSGNSYKYVVSFSSWTGTSSETTITVSNGKVIKREFRYTVTKYLPDNFPKEELEWVENENELNARSNSGAAALTLDEIYTKAKSEWLVKRDNAKTYFEAKNDGLISSCGYVEDGCADDCFNGIRISYIGVVK